MFIVVMDSKLITISTHVYPGQEDGGGGGGGGVQGDWMLNSSQGVGHSTADCNQYMHICSHSCSMWGLIACGGELYFLKVKSPAISTYPCTLGGGACN